MKTCPTPGISLGSLRRPQEATTRFIQPLNVSYMPVQNSLPGLLEAILEKYCVKCPTVIKDEVGFYILKWKDLKDLYRGMYLCELFSVTGGRWGSELIMHLCNIKFHRSTY